MNHTARLTELLKEARELPESERGDLVRLIRREDATLADLLAEQLEGACVSDTPPVNGSAPRSGDELAADDTRSLLQRLAGRSEPRDRYRLDGELARGGQGAILRVHDEDLKRELAMKVILGKADARTGYGPDLHRRSLSRFLEEAQVTGQLDHPGIVPVHELGVNSEGRVYFTMKLVKGRDLKTIFDLVRRGAEDWSLTRALGVMLKVCEAMAYAHSKGVIHRDLKPANVMVGRYGEVYVMDWGIARVLEAVDRKDIRLQPADTTTAPEVTRKELADGTTLVTMDGDVLGTPAYMSPEQARGDIEAMGPRSDVYAVGCMLYHLFATRPPFVGADSDPSHLAIWTLVQAGPPEPLQRIAPDIPVELVAICEKAMEREPANRYADMQALGEDLRAYLEQRVVQAHETGVLAEVKKWVRRNRKLAATAALAGLLGIVGLITTTVLKGRADRQRANVVRLSAFQNLEDLTAEADRLWPAWDDNVDAYRDWLVRARELVAGLDPAADGGDIGHRAQLARLRRGALPRTALDDRSDDRKHPRFAELETKRKRLENDERALALLRGERESEEVELSSSLPADAPELTRLAYPMVDPHRVEFGREAEGLALARLALECAQDDAEYVRASEVMAWASFSNGMHEEALAVCEEGLSMAPDDRGLLHAHEHLEDAIKTVQSDAFLREVEALRQEVEALEAQVIADRRWRFESTADSWWHEQLVKVIREVEAYAEPATGLIEGTSREHGQGVARRLEWAEQIVELTLTGTEARRRWDAALASIADPARCPAYAGLVIEPQIGLLPIGRDETTGLWEFSHPLSGDEPERAGGEWVVAEETGLVFVLLPGGVFLMGTQSQNRGGPNYDPQANPREGPPHDVELSPFFISKYEMTQAQWILFVGSNPSGHVPPDNFVQSLVHPVEQMRWAEAKRTLERMGLALPTEAQWEYAARAGTDTPWWTGLDRDELIGAANLADQSAAKALLPWATIMDWPELEDGYVWHGPVTDSLPNPFGLYGVHGGVWELCEDADYNWFYAHSPRNDPVNLAQELGLVIVRGGSFYQTASMARSFSRGNAPLEAGRSDVGVRPARRLHGEYHHD